MFSRLTICGKGRKNEIEEERMEHRGGAGDEGRISICLRPFITLANASSLLRTSEASHTWTLTHADHGVGHLLSRPDKCLTGRMFVTCVSL